MADKTPADKQPAKPRNPIERAIVWGIIGIGVLVAGLEANAFFSYSGPMNALQKRMKEASESENILTADDVKKIVGNKTPDESVKLDYRDTAIGAGTKEIYRYNGLLKTREIHVYYGVQGVQGQVAEVLSVSSNNEETLNEALAKLPKTGIPQNPSVPKSTTGPGAPGPTGPSPTAGRPKKAVPTESEPAPAAEEAEKPAADTPATEAPAAETPADTPATEKPAAE